MTEGRAQQELTCRRFSSTPTNYDTHLMNNEYQAQTNSKKDVSFTIKTIHINI